LRKALYFIDAGYYERSLTGLNYIKAMLVLIPENKFYKKMVTFFLNDYIIREEYPSKNGHVKIRHYIKDGFKNEEYIKNIDFNENIKDIISSILNFVSDKSANKLSEITHNRGYNDVDMGEVIPFNKVVEWVINTDLNSFPVFTPEEIAE
jgi:hypothetical protein